MVCAATLSELSSPAVAQQWLMDANNRIEQYRKADLTISILDSAGSPVTGADVHVQMQRHDFGFGTAVTANWINSTSTDARIYRRKLLENFNQVVFENDLKWPAWTDEPWGWGGFNWNSSQQALNWLDANELPARGHYLSWATWSGSDAWGGSQDTATLRDRLMSRIADVASTVGDRVFEWDVINHPVGWLNDTYENRLGDGIYTDIVNHARQVVPEDVPLWINEDDVIAGGSRANGYAQDIQELIDDGAAPDGIGFQAHFIQEWGRIISPQLVYSQIDRFDELVPRLRVTEFDIDVGGDAERQADLLRDYLTVMFSHPAMEAVTMWGFWENAHWRPDAALYEDDWTEKPALEAYQDLVFSEWWTDETGQSDAEGVFELRAFMGDYEIVVTVDGQQFVTSGVSLETDLGLLIELPIGVAPTADFNADGLIDGADFTAWQRGFGALDVTSADGDANGDGQVDKADLQVWEVQFGADAAGAWATSIPEPGTRAMLATSLVFIALYCGARRNSHLPQSGE